jgi:putative transposase
LLIKVAPQFSSQTCAECGHVDAGNRLSQAEFHCLRCGHEDNADHNAARVIQQRGVKKIREYVPKAKKQVKLYKSKLGSERSEVTPEESHVSRNGGNIVAQGSMSQEILLVTARNPISSAKR